MIISKGNPFFRLRSWLHVDLSQVSMVHDLVSERVEDGFPSLAYHRTEPRGGSIRGQF